jgi:hypothetical protein
MATVVTLTQLGAAVGDRSTAFQATVSNTGSSSLTLSLLSASESTGSAQIGQPNFLTPNVALGLGSPTINAAGTFSTVFNVVFPAPNTPGPSPNAAAGAAGVQMGQPVRASYFLTVTAQTSDGSVASTTLVVPVLSAIDPFPVPEGGALQFRQGSNLINGIIMGVL